MKVSFFGLAVIAASLLPTISAAPIPSGALTSRSASLAARKANSTEQSLDDITKSMDNALQSFNAALTQGIENNTDVESIIVDANKLKYALSHASVTGDPISDSTRTHVIHSMQKVSVSMLALKEAKADDSSPSDAGLQDLIPSYLALIKLLPDIGISVGRDLGPAVQLVINILTP